jgi:hypothetical protein
MRALANCARRAFNPDRNRFVAPPRFCARGRGCDSAQSTQVNERAHDWNSEIL